MNSIEITAAFPDAKREFNRDVTLAVAIGLLMAAALLKWWV